MTEHEPELLNVAPGEPHDSLLSETIELRHRPGARACC